MFPYDNLFLQDLKLRYYKLMIELDEHDEKFLDVARHYSAIYNTKSIKENESDALQVLAQVAFIPPTILLLDRLVLYLGLFL